MTSVQPILARAAPPVARTVLLGGVLGIDTIGHCVALASLAFAGPLSFALGYGTMLILLSSTIVTFVLAWRSVFPGAAAIAEDTTIAILAPAMVLAAGNVNGPPEAQLATAVAIMAISTLLSGVLMLLIGQFHLGRIARIMPFPVAAGFLASSGALLIVSALNLMTETGTLGEVVGLIATEGVPMNLILGLALAGVLLLSTRYVGGALSALVPLVAAMLAFYIVTAALGLSLDDVREIGLLPEIPTQTLPAYPDPSLIPLIDWSVVAATSLTIAVVVFLNAIGFVLNVGGIEMAVRADVNIDAEARVTGATNIGVGLFGGYIGFIASDSTIMAHQLGCSRPMLGVALGTTTLIGFLFAAQIVSHIPVFVAAGLVLFFGTSMLIDWMVNTWARLRPLDWSIIPIIVATTVAIDILVAIGVGLLVALVIFVYTYAGLPVLRFHGSGATRRSPVDRAPEDEAILSQLGNRTHVLGLQGFLFFGSVEKVVDAVRHRMEAPPPIDALIIDFHHVTGLDSAACAAFLKLELLADAGQFRIALAGVPEGFVQSMGLWGIGTPDHPVFRFYATLASALEDVEEDRLVVRGKDPAASPTLLDRLAPLIPRAADLLGRMERMEARPGDVLIRAGGTEGDIFFIENGRVNVQLSNPSGVPIRLRSLRAGAIVGEAARYLGRKRTADVVVHAPSVIWKLSDDAIERLEAEDRDLAAMLHACMARSLAEKVEKTNGMLTAALA